MQTRPAVTGGGAEIGPVQSGISPLRAPSDATVNAGAAVRGAGAISSLRRRRGSRVCACACSQRRAGGRREAGRHDGPRQRNTGPGAMPVPVRLAPVSDWQVRSSFPPRGIRAGPVAPARRRSSDLPPDSRARIVGGPAGTLRRRAGRTREVTAPSGRWMTAPCTGHGPRAPRASRAASSAGRPWMRTHPVPGRNTLSRPGSGARSPWPRTGAPGTVRRSGRPCRAAAVIAPVPQGAAGPGTVRDHAVPLTAGRNATAQQAGLHGSAPGSSTAAPADRPEPAFAGPVQHGSCVRRTSIADLREHRHDDHVL